ncbi:MAG: signal peptidase I [Candidatus Gastranaerophilales bacterium]|nr:signal peptidase I [Candidatus Gastranaerophilales bacterium]
MINKIIEYFKRSTKLLLFILVFCAVAFIYNQNFQTLNYILKRGTILEYSIPSNKEINQDNVKNKLNELNIKYSFINIVDNSEFNIFSKDNERIEKTLYIGLPILAQKNKEQIFNNVSDFIFENCEDSKLIDIKSLNNNYNEPFMGFLKFLGILFVTSVIWLILLYLIYDTKTINQKIKESVEKYFEEQKNNFKKLIEKTKEKGISYLITRILFDEDKDGKETNVTHELISTIVFVLICVIVIRYFIGELRWIPSGSMRPTILEHDRVFVEKLDYPKKAIERGDILVFYPPSTVLSKSPFAIFARLSGIFCKDVAFIKRAIGLPNEKFEIKKDPINNEYRVYINDVPLNEPYISSKTEWTPCVEGMRCGPFIIPENSYFMMGDNRNNSQDSRFWGFLEGDRIIGRANFMFWPIRRINVLRDKYLNLHTKKAKDGFESGIYILNRYEFL